MTDRGKTDQDLIAGGCMCGAVRYTATKYERAVHCHCRMCQRATGAAFATWVCIAITDFAMVRGRPVFRRSSEKCQRGFCPACGTPLFMKYDDDNEIAVSLGSIDEPSKIQPTYSIWTAERLGIVKAVDRHLIQFTGDPPS
jgi:hypothetical protein